MFKIAQNENIAVAGIINTNKNVRVNLNRHLFIRSRRRLIPVITGPFVLHLLEWPRIGL